MNRGTTVALLLLLLAPISALAADARRLIDLNPGKVGSYPTNLTTFAGQLFFSAYTVNTGFEFWRLSGTNISLVADINSTKDDLGGVFEGNDSFPSEFRSFAGELYFSAYEPMHGAELWKYTGSNVVRISDINLDLDPNPTNNNPQSSWPRELTVMGGSLYFTATSETNPPNYELWKYDTNGVSLALDLHPDVGFDYSSHPKGLRVSHGALYFMADDGTNGWELVRYTPDETTVLDIHPGPSSSYPKYLTSFGSNLLFQAYTDATGFELWSTDGTNVNLAADLVPDTGSSYPEFLTTLNGAVYFRATTPQFGYELYKYDGTNVSLAANINPLADSFPKNLIRYRNAIVFTADDGVHGWELWRYDGTNALLLADLNTIGSSYPEDLTIGDGTLYFTANNPQRGYELWKYDGTNVTLAANLNSGKSSSYPRSLTPLGSKLYFSAADDGRTNWEPWVFDPGFTNQRPMVSLIAPVEGTVFENTNSVTISATASDEFEVIGVEFLANGVPIATVDRQPWTLSTNLPSGTNTLTAVATDSSGATTTSAAVTIFIQQPPLEPATITTVTRTATTTTITAQTTVSGQFSLESSTDLTTWTVVDTQPAVEGTVTFMHECAEEAQFYRVQTL